MERPDIRQASPEIQAYITYLEQKLLEKETAVSPTASASRRSTASDEPSEPPTSLNVITVSQNGVAKRTLRHLYTRQRRSGMGVFDLDVDAPDKPALLAVADETADVLLFTNLGRAFRLAVDKIPETAVRARGSSLISFFKFLDNEQIVAVLPADAGVYVALVSERGWVQRVRSSHLGRSLIPGMRFHDPERSGFITAGCWTRGEEHLFIGTQQGKGIRFRETQVPARHGCLGLRVDEGDVTVAITAVQEAGAVFLLSGDGKGTVRQMSGFRMNKAPGAGPKVALKSDNMVAAATVSKGDDIFIVSQTGKMIRFQAEEVPSKEGVVQGVHCMTLRNDEATAAVATAVPS